VLVVGGSVASRGLLRFGDSAKRELRRLSTMPLWSSAGASLIRPDGYVPWRSPRFPCGRGERPRRRHRIGVAGALRGAAINDPRDATSSTLKTACTFHGTLARVQRVN